MPNFVAHVTDIRIKIIPLNLLIIFSLVSRDITKIMKKKKYQRNILNINRKKFRKAQVKTLKDSIMSWRTYYLIFSTPRYNFLMIIKDFFYHNFSLIAPRAFNTGVTSFIKSLLWPDVQVKTFCSLRKRYV